MKAKFSATDNKITTRQYDLLFKKKFIEGHLVIDTAKKAVIAKVKFYTSHKGGGAYHCLFTYSNETRFGGTVAKAGGYGYNKQIASLSFAIRGASIELDEGVKSVPDVLEAVAIALGSKQKDLMTILF